MSREREVKLLRFREQKETEVRLNELYEHVKRQHVDDSTRVSTGLDTREYWTRHAWVLDLTRVSTGLDTREYWTRHAWVLDSTREYWARHISVVSQRILVFFKNTFLLQPLQYCSAISNHLPSHDTSISSTSILYHLGWDKDSYCKNNLMM